MDRRNKFKKTKRHSTGNVFSRANTVVSSVLITVASGIPTTTVNIDYMCCWYSTVYD